MNLDTQGTSSGEPQAIMSFFENGPAVHALHAEAFTMTDLVAYFDLSSGFLRLNMTADECHAWTATIEAPALDARFEAFYHEGTHFLQTVHCGYLFFVASRVCEIVRRSIGYMIDTKAEEPALDPALGADLRAAVAHLHTAGAAGLTPHAIVESSAFHAQKRRVLPGLDHAGYLDLLDRDAPTAVYRDAYDIAAEVMGDAAFNIFPYASYRALCSRDPARSFVAICQEFARRRLRLETYDHVSSDDPEGIMPFVHAADAAVGDDHIGGPAQVMQTLSGRFVPHQTYVDALSFVYEEQARDPALDAWAIAPHLTVGAVRVMLRQPAILNPSGPNARAWPTAFLDPRGRVRSDDHYRSMMMVAAIAARLVGNVLDARYPDTRAPMLPPSAVGTAVFPQARDVDAIERELALTARLGAVRYFVPIDDLFRPDPALLDYLTATLRAEATFALDIVEPGEPRRTLLVHRLDDKTLRVSWIRTSAGHQPSGDGTASIDRVSATSDVPASVVVRRDGPGSTWSGGMHSKVLHLALAWLDVQSRPEGTRG